MNRRSFLQRASAALATLGLPGLRPKPPAIPYAFTAGITKAISEADVKLIVECSHDIWCGAPLVRLLGSTKDVEQWTISYLDPRTNATVVRKGELV